MWVTAVGFSSARPPTCQAPTLLDSSNLNGRKRRHRSPSPAAHHAAHRQHASGSSPLRLRLIATARPRRLRVSWLRLGGAAAPLQTTPAANSSGRGRGSGLHGGVTQYADPMGRLPPPWDDPSAATSSSQGDRPASCHHANRDGCPCSTLALQPSSCRIAP